MTGLRPIRSDNHGSARLPTVAPSPIADVIPLICANDSFAGRGDPLVIDGHGATLMPGLSEAHAHFVWSWPAASALIFSGAWR
jgi:hypothetical protein